MKSFLWISVFVLGILMAGGTTAVWACNSAGPNKHVGNVTAIDSGAKTFTIRDAETDHLMTFEASDTALRDLRVNDRVMVGYKEEHGKLTAVEVQS